MAKNPDLPYTVLKQDLMDQDLGQYLMRLASVVLFCLIPVFVFRHNPVLLNTGLALFVAVEVEVAGRVFRGTIKSINQPKSQLHDASNHSHSHFTRHSSAIPHQPFEPSPHSAISPASCRDDKEEGISLPLSAASIQHSTTASRALYTPLGFSGRRVASITLPAIATTPHNAIGRR
ncbi:hypothetical protein CBS101457_003462 [Exobasidium rhododendri]|nr:hypothetical protein CBS101457_003462 [Exobasidium rhododendri]